ncbi:hypothetical protein CEXT_238111 [Caerostris extrusa]|uniref:Uncharacterized protein n=1 Tax=Caerostris extrusa TaxID=172846 RepID=A0AAV4RJJ4_CAEEX|nr:hypothetical protein CEXT_238111 [Caerostris extrusa]
MTFFVKSCSDVLTLGSTHQCSDSGKYDVHRNDSCHPYMYHYQFIDERRMENNTFPEVYPEFKQPCISCLSNQINLAYEGKLGITKLRNAFPENKWCVSNRRSPLQLKNGAKECRFVILPSLLSPPPLFPTPLFFAAGAVKTIFREKEGLRFSEFRFVCSEEETNAVAD